MVGFDRIDRVAVLEEKLGEQPGAGADIGDDGLGRESGIFRQVGNDLGRVAGAVFAVVFNAGGEALGGGQRFVQFDSLFFFIRRDGRI